MKKKIHEILATRTQHLQSRKGGVDQFIRNKVQVKLECIVLSASKLTSFSQFRYVYVSGSEVQLYS